MVRVMYLGPENLVDFVQRQLGSDYDLAIALDEEMVKKCLPSTQVILDAYMRVRFPRDLLDLAPNLKLFVSATTGADHVDSGALAARGIPLLTLRGQVEILRNLTPAAELSWLLLLACARGARSAIDEVIAGVWNRNNHPGVMLRGKTLGLIGCGRIGQWVARYASAFGMERLGYDPYANPWPEGIVRSTLDDLLQRADFISIHVSFTEATRSLIGRREFALMKTGVIVVNTSRGEVMDEAEMLRELESGHIRAAGLDVLVGEPTIENHPLLSYARRFKNLIITPHIGGFSPDAVREVLTFCCTRIRGLTESVIWSRS